MTASGSVGDEHDVRRPDAGVSASTLLGDDEPSFEDVLSGAVPGPLAVVGGPYAGRERVLDAATERLDATRLGLAPGDDASTLRAELGDGPVVVDGCHHLYERRIGGFDPLEAFLDSLADVDAPVVTGWNRYAWSYLAAVRDLDRAFPARVDVGPVPAEAIAEHLLGREDEMPRFVPDDRGTAGAVEVRRYPIEWRGHTASIPVPVPNPDALAALRDTGDQDPQDTVFERLAAVSGGNVGVAAAIWESSVDDDGEVRPSDVVAPGTDLDLDREEAFCLRIVLSKERVGRTELLAVVGDRTDRVLGRLAREGLVVDGDDTVCLDPSAVPAVAEATERRGIP